MRSIISLPIHLSKNLPLFFTNEPYHTQSISYFFILTAANSGDLWQYSGGNWAWWSQGELKPDRFGNYSIKGFFVVVLREHPPARIVTKQKEETNCWKGKSGHMQHRQQPEIISLIHSPTHSPPGVPSPFNFPGGRRRATTWVDSAGDLWLFGGEYKDWPSCE